MGVMDRYNEKKKKEEKVPDSKTTPMGVAERYKLYQSSDVGSVDDNYINTFISDTNDFFSSLSKGSVSYNDATSKLEDLSSRYDSIQGWLYQNKSRFDEKSYKDLSSTFDGLKVDFDGVKDLYSKWETAEDYEKDVAAAKDYEAKSTADINSLSKEIEEMERVAEEYAAIDNEYYSTGNRILYTTEEGKAISDKYNAFNGQYGTLDEFQASINEKKLFMADAKRIQDGIKLASVSDPTSELYDPEFDKYTGFAGSTWVDNGFERFFTWDDSANAKTGYEDIRYDYINNHDNMVVPVENSADAGMMHWLMTYEQMTEEEVNIYNYYYAKEGKEAADKYLDSIQESLNAREATRLFTNLEGKTFQEMLFGVSAGLDQFASGLKGLKNAVTGNDEYIAPSVTQIASGMVREDLKDVGPMLPKWLGGASIGQAGYDAVTTTSNMLPSILTSTAVNAIAPGSGAVVGTALLGSSAGGNAYQEMINLGYDKGQARAYATLVGGSEAILQYALGGISSLGGGSNAGIFQSIAGKWLPHVDNAFARVAIKLGGNMLDEGLEEGIQEILNPWFKNLVLNTNEKVNWSEVAYSGLLGALTAGFMEGPTTIAGDVNNYRTGKNLQAKDISAQRLAEIGKTFAADSEAYQLAGKVNENTGAYTLGRLFNEIGATLTEQNISEITEALVAKGMSETVARKNAEALAYVVEGGQLSDAQIAMIEANDVLSEVARTTLIDANTTWNQRANGYNEMLKALADEVASPKKSKAKQAQENTLITDTVDGQKEIATESHEEAESVDTSPAKVKNIADISKKTITLEDGSEVNVKDADLSPDDGVRIETIASIDGISTEDANFVLNTLRSNTGASAQMDSLGAKEAYKYGFYGFSQDHIAKHGVFANSLTESQRQAIYEAGQKARQKQIESSSPKATTKQRGIYFDHGGGNVVSFKDADKSLLSEKKRSAGVQAAVILNKLGIGGDIYFFESYRNSEGKLVYKNSKGKEVKAPNGWFSETDGSIHIDLNAGVKGDGFVLFTLAHELTHFIEKWSPQKYKVLADFLIENYEKGHSMDKLVRAKQAYLSNIRGKKVSYDEAYSEVIADSMEAMLADGNVMEKIMELKAKDNDLVMKIKQFFDNLLTKIRNAYKGLTPDSAEGKAVLEMTDSIEKIQQLFAEALVEASDNFQTAQAQFSTDSLRGNADGAVAQSEVTTALVETTDGEILTSERTEYEALPKQMMSLSDGSGKLLSFIEGLIPTKLKGLSGKTTNGHTGRDVRAYAMGISGFSQEQIQRVNEFMDSMSKFMTEAGVTYKFIGLQDVKDAKLHYTYNADGSIKSIVLSAMVKNGDYPVNFDLSSICKKRVAMSKLIDKLAKRGSLDNGTVKLTPSNIFKINTTLKNEGYETACLGCFVESKRYNSLEWAKTFCNKWNAAVKKVNPNATYFGYGDNTFTEDSFSLEQAVKIDEAATKYITTTKVERLANALKKYKAREQAGLPLVEKLSDAAKKRLVKSETISDELKEKYLNADVTTLTMADVEFLLENEVLPGASLSNKQAVTEMVKSGEVYQHLLKPSDLLTDRGISKLEALPNFHGVLYGHYGSGTPKLMQSYTPYNSEIALLPANKNNDQTLEEYLYSIAGVRMQSFSDFQIQNIYDYLQMVADLAARKLPAHAYTKEISFAKLLGMTGIKTNLSVMFDIDPMVDKAHAGLTKLNKLVHRGEYAKVVLEDEQGKWVYNIGDYQTQKLFAEAYPEEAKRFLQSIGFADAVKLQSTPGYSANCGIIGVGYSDLGIFAMLDDNRIRYIIPYHASSLPAEIKVATNIEIGTDYTSYQNNMKIASIVDKDGNAVDWTIKEAYKRLGSGQAVINELNEKVRTEGWVVKTKKAQNGHGTYGLYENLQQTNDPRQTAGNFMDWCIGNGTLPLFYQFASHENYYKLLYDFNVYDCVTEEYAPQQAVTNTYPTMVDGQVQAGNVTDGGFDAEYLQGAIDKQMAFMDEYSRNLDEDLENLADNLEEGNYSPSIRFSPRDTSSVPDDISSFVDTALTDKKSNQQMEVTVATALDNKAIHRLGTQFNGHYDGSARTMTSRYIRHIINNHGDPIIEALRGQLHMDGDAIKIALSKLQSGAGRVIGNGESIRGNPTILTEIPINGYTLYAEEPVEQLSGTDLEGRTMFMTPTSTKALIPTKSANIPRRRSEGHRVIIDGKKRIVNSFLTDASGNIAEVNYIENNGSPYAGGKTQFLFAMCNDTDVLSKYAPNGATIGKANVAINNPYIVTPQNPVFTAEDFEKGLVVDRAREIKDLGYDAIIMDYNPGDNYMVLAFDKKSVVKLSDRDSLTPDQQKHFDYNQKQKTVGSALKTLKGSPIKRSTKYGVGKEIGGEIYFHKNYAEDILPDEVLSQAMQLLEENQPGFEYNCLKYNPKTGVVAFQEAPDFDSAREPVVGDYVSVNTDTGVVKTGHSNYIWHHKWNWVKNDYPGFDVEESWNWSKQWLSTLTEVSDGNGIERWNAQLDKFGLPKDGDSNLYSEREQEYDSKDTSVKILPATFTKFGLKSTDRVLDWGGGQYDIAKKAIEHGYPGIKFEVVDAFNRTPTHNDRILAEYAENPATVLTINNVLNVIKETDIIEDVIRESKEYLAEDGVCYIKIYEGNDVDGKTGNGKVTSNGWQNNQPAEWYKPFAEKYYKYVERVGDILVASDTPIDKKALPKVSKETAGSMREKVKEIAKSEPSQRESLYSDRVLMGSLFSGGGTLEAGLVYQMLDKEFAVEYNKKIAATYTDNHGKEHMFVGDVQDFNSKGKKNVFYLHASPVCKNFSPASHGGGEKTLDIVTAQATARVLEEQMPQVFTVENVKRYIGSEAYKIITDKLTELGYKWDVDVYKASDYGNATKRERMIIRAVKDGNLPAKPEKVSGITSWGEATRDLWDTDLIPSTLVKSKIEAIRNTPELKNLRLTKLDRPLMIYDTTKSKKITYAWADELAPTLTTKCGDARIIMPDGKVYEPTPKFMGRIQGLPDDYKYPKAKTNAFKIIGNGIPTQLTKAVMGGVLDSAYEQTHDGQVLYSDRDYVAYDRTAILKESKVDEYLNDYAAWSSPKYAKAYITYMRPRDFLKLTTTGIVERYYIDEQAGELDAERLSDSRPGIYLRIDHETGKVTGHEGRHRMSAMGYAGIDRVPVLLVDESNNMSKTDIDRMYLHGQFDETEMSVVMDLVPLSVENRSRVIEKFATQSSNQRIGERIGYNQTLRFQDRTDESVSNRSLLANAFEGLAQNDIERNKIQEYKGKIDLINAEEKKLSELNAKIKELSFAKGPRDAKAIRDLQFEARQTANRINTYDKQLLRLEASKPLQDVLDREKKRAYQKAEQRGKEALDAYKEKAAKTQRELLEKWKGNRKAAVSKARETAEKRSAKEKLQKLVLDTTKWLTYPAKTDVKCPDILKKPYADFLNGIDMSSKRLANGGDPTKNDLRLANAMDSLATALDKIMTAQDPTQDTDKVLDTGYLDLPADFVMKLRDMTESIKSMMVEGDYVVNTMTAAEVRQLSQIIRTLNHAIKTMSNLYANLRFANVEALGFDTMEFMDALGEIEKTGGMKDFVQWDNALPYYAFKRFGKGGESVFEGLMDAQDKLAFLAQEIFNFRDKAWTDKEAKVWSEDTHTITLPNGNELTLTTADAMSIYCLSRREQGLQHLLGGGTRVLGIQKGSQKAKDSRSLLTIEDIDAINSSLTDRQKQVAEAIQEFMSTVCSDWGNEISMKRFLTKEFTEKFYFPIESNDENLPVKDPAAQQSDLFRLLNISATKPLTPGANNEVIIRNIFDVFTGHASDMARLNAYGMGLLDYMKWLNYREKTVTDEGQVKVRGVRKSMQLAYGDAAMGYVLNLVKDVNGRASDGGDPNLLMKWMRAAKTASVGNSLRVATLQITSYPRASLVLSPKSLTLGLSKLPNINRAKKYCGIALWKSFGFYDTNISRSIEDQMKGVTDVKQKLIELSLKGAEWGDAITWGALWNACEYEVAKTTQNKVGSEEFYQEVGKKLREVVYRTQVVDSNLTRSQIMRSKRGMAQEAAAFMSEPTLSANILMDAGFEFGMEKRRTGSAKTAWNKTGTYIGRAIAVYSIGQLTAALLESLWDAWRDDDDDEFDEKFVDAFVENLALDLVPFNKIPIVSDVFEGALSLVGVGFYSSDKMSSTWLTQAVSAVDTWKDVFSGESSTTVYNALYKSVRAVSSYVGVSFSGLMREGVALWNNTAGAYDSTLKIRTWGLSKTDTGALLYDAIVSGNTRQAESLKAQFEDQKAIDSAMRTAIKDHFESGDIDRDTAEQYLIKFGGLEDDDAYWKVEEWKYETESGEDFKKYNDFYEAVQTGKNLKVVIQKYTDNGVEKKTLASQITQYFKPLYKEMSKTERAGIKGYLLNAYSLLGYDRNDKSKDIDNWLKD